MLEIQRLENPTPFPGFLGTRHPHLLLTNLLRTLPSWLVLHVVVD